MQASDWPERIVFERKSGEHSRLRKIFDATFVSAKWLRYLQILRDSLSSNRERIGALLIDEDDRKQFTAQEKRGNRNRFAALPNGFERMFSSVCAAGTELVLHQLNAR